MHYDIEADFYPLTTCNYRCAYCFLPPAALAAKLVVHATAEQWEAGFDATGKTWLLHITGGEPFIYPGFVELCERLSRRHWLSINSNLSHRRVEEFAAKIDPARVHFINAAVHPEEREKHGPADSFIGHVRRLRDAGFGVLTSVVMTPSMVDAFPSVSERFTTHGLGVIPKILRGPHEGKHYPAAYTPEQRARLGEYLREAGRQYADVLARMGEPPTIDMFTDERLLQESSGNRGLSYRGKLCGSGYNFVQVRPDGGAFRCGSGQHLGNILQRTLRLREGPAPCDTSYCPYFCEKYTSPQFTAKARIEWSPLTLQVGAGTIK